MNKMTENSATRFVLVSVHQTNPRPRLLSLQTLTVIASWLRRPCQPFSAACFESPVVFAQMQLESTDLAPSSAKLGVDQTIAHWQSQTFGRSSA